MRSLLLVSAMMAAPTCVGPLDKVLLYFNFNSLRQKIKIVAARRHSVDGTKIIYGLPNATVLRYREL